VQTTTAESQMRFPWADTQSALRAAASDTEGHFGKTIDLPAASMPPITIRVHAWPAGWSNRPYRYSVNVVYVVMQGHGHSTLGDRTFNWEFGDTLAAPSWCRIEHQASSDTVMFAMSDESLMRWVKYYRLESL
jgi:gentisate 1,2-dioxygenase